MRQRDASIEDQLRLCLAESVKIGVIRRSLGALIAPGKRENGSSGAE
jgi:hypothetical protein